MGREIACTTRNAQLLGSWQNNEYIIAAAFLAPRTNEPLQPGERHHVPQNVLIKCLGLAFDGTRQETPDEVALQGEEYQQRESHRNKR